jgi:hypothetical protein
MGDAHALAAAAGGGLDHHRIADLVGDLHRFLVIGDDPEMTGHGRDLCRRRGLLGLDLVAHRRNGFGIRADENDAGFGQRQRKGLAFGEKAIPRMHGLGAGLLAGLDDLLDDEIALGCRRRADRNRLVRHRDVQRVLVGVGIDRDGRDPHAAGGFDDPAGDFAAIGDQNTLEHAENRSPSGLLSGPAHLTEPPAHLPARASALCFARRAPQTGRFGGPGFLQGSSPYRLGRNDYISAIAAAFGRKISHDGR